MKTQIFSVYDKAVGAFMPPFFCRSKGEAVRSFSDACSDGKTNFCLHPDDFALYHIGEFDDAAGALGVTTDNPLRVISARECAREQLEPVDYTSVASTPTVRPQNGR